MPTRPPAHLSASSKRMWTELIDEYTLDDCAALALLTCALESRDASERARMQIRRDGQTYTDPQGVPRAHPLVGIERAAKAQMLSSFRALRLEPPK